MANLPPKPESPLKEERRLDNRDGVTTARPMAPLPSPRVPHPDRSYVPHHQRSEPDSYVAVYASRRPPLRDWERDRRDRDYDRHRDSRRDWRESDRRDSRPYDRRREDDRFRPRRYGLLVAIHALDHLFAAVHALPHQDDIPAPDHHECLALTRDHHGIDLLLLLAPVPEFFREAEVHALAPHLRSDSNSVTTPYQIVHEHHELAQDLILVLLPVHETKLPPPPTLPAIPRAPSPKKEDIDVAPTSLRPVATIPSPHNDEKSTINVEKPDIHPYPMQPSLNHPAKSEVPVKVEPTREQLPHLKPEVMERPPSSCAPKPSKSEVRGRSHSPPKGPRATQWRKISKSPPKGPRNHGIATPSMMPVPVPPPVHNPAPAPSYPTGPRADRRPTDQPILRSSEFTKIQPPTSDRWTRNMIHPKSGRYGTSQLELDLVRYRSHRVNLNQVHDQVSRTTRRALHELDMATIDLRMAETRRRIADAQVEKAKLGVLGIDGSTPDMTEGST
ncbi:hypothetical protein AGABI2DRAFT_176683 [Agaricus bisporus var. bisporus H97]|uniref:hypothetical protein n=1 Tax=Agaricus bisporus var. bisporus (strain H97 / ATCC MYA-4626 / FGSC 10389) TaxID=936046 RepID=UPI00029F791D|nr:hypothetical protein AGABI2DRAFT_176683 [Agaricus bisporus var. bisporus H97]EKV50218.1 hypothetical protein AGABI2DRAFT_176683 [Agaricus bisporus var. bisporus H97]